MATLQQIEANRLNAQKSTGPRSAEGKAVSSMNALKSGIDAQSLLIRGEDPAGLEALIAEYVERFRPASVEQRLYVDTLIRDDWQLRRLAKADAQIWEHQMQSTWKLSEICPIGEAFCRGDATFLRLQRRIDAVQRSYRLTLHELERLQSQPEPPPIEVPAASLPIGCDGGAAGDSAQHQPAQPVSVSPGREIGFVPPAPLPAPAACARDTSSVRVGGGSILNPSRNDDEAPEQPPVGA
jgi:hypothetical protein